MIHVQYLYTDPVLSRNRESEGENSIYIYMFIFIQMDSLLFMHYILHMNLLIACQTHTYIYICIHHSFLYTYVIICARLSPHTGAKVWHLLSPRQIGPDRRHCQDLQWARSSGSWSTWQAGHQRPLFRDWRESTPHGDVQDELHQRRRTEGGLQ